MQLGFPWYYKYLSWIFILGHSSSSDTVCLFSLLHTNFLLPEKLQNLFLILELLLSSSVFSYQSFEVLCSLVYDMTMILNPESGTKYSHHSLHLCTVQSIAVHQLWGQTQDSSVVPQTRNEIQHAFLRERSHGLSIKPVGLGLD